MKTFTLVFPDGLMIDGFEWTVAGWYVREFPQSGIHSQRLNVLRYTAPAITQAGIQLVPALVAPGQFVAVGPSVISADNTIARAISKTMAKRIANALNKHIPNREGV